MALFTCLAVLATGNNHCTIYFREGQDTRTVQQITQELHEHLGNESVSFGEVRAAGLGLKMIVTLPEFNHKTNTRKQIDQAKRIER